MAKRMNFTQMAPKILEELDGCFKVAYTKEELGRKLRKLGETNRRHSSYPSLLADLYSALEQCGIGYERGGSLAYYQTLVDRATLPADQRELEDWMLYQLYCEYRRYPAPRDYMLRMVERLCAPEDGWSADTLRLRILKQFMKYGNYLADAGYRGKGVIQTYVREKLGKTPGERQLLEGVDDGLFDACFQALETARRDADVNAGQLRNLRRKMRLILLADDLAEGKFRAGGATRQGLYLFALAFGMTYRAGEGDTDLEKNLFRDYYTNNLIRFLSRDYREKAAALELDPDGRGINYKNFAEVIYLYYLAREEGTPAEKIAAASAMIQRVQRTGTGDVPAPGRDGSTQDFRALLRPEVLKLREEAFERFVCTHYDCQTWQGGVVLGAMQLHADQRTAYRCYREVIEALWRELEGACAAPEEWERGLEYCNYGLWFTDVAGILRGCPTICDSNPEGVDRASFEAFVELLLAANRFLGYTAEEEASGHVCRQERSMPARVKTRALYVPNPEAMTRTSLIVAYYYLFNVRQEQRGDGLRESFLTLFTRFKEELDPLLERCGYQLVEGKNFFDVLVVFSAYAYQFM